MLPNSLSLAFLFCFSMNTAFAGTGSQEERLSSTPSLKPVSRTRFFQKNEFIVSEPISFRDESESTKSNPDLKKSSTTIIRDGCIFDANNNYLDTGFRNYIYVLSTKGQLYITANKAGIHHSHFLKSNPEKYGYAIGKNIACAGEIKVQGGKIIWIDNMSGHYLPVEDQLKVAVKYLNELGVLSSQVKIFAKTPIYEGGMNKQIPLKSILSENVGAILDQYPAALKWTRTYIETQIKHEELFFAQLRHLEKIAPKAFLERPVTEFFPSFHMNPTTTGKIDFGSLSLDNHRWEAFAVLKTPSSNTTIEIEDFRWEPNFTTWKLETLPKNGVIKEYPTCWYTLKHQASNMVLNFYLIPENEEDVSFSQLKKTCINDL